MSDYAPFPSAECDSVFFILPFDETKDIIIEKFSSDGEHYEVTIYLRDKESGLAWQDIALIKKSQDNKHVECSVWTEYDGKDYIYQFNLVPFQLSDN